MQKWDFLLSSSKERGILGIESIHVAIFSSCQYMKIIAIQLHRYDYSSENKKHLRGSTQYHKTPLGHYNFFFFFLFRYNIMQLHGLPVVENDVLVSNLKNWVY